MKLTDEEIIKLIPEPQRYFGHSKLSPMYTKEEILEFSRFLEAELLKVDMEPVAYKVTDSDGVETVWHYKFGGGTFINEPLYTAAQLAAAREQGRKEGLENVARYLSESGYGELVEYVRAMKGE